MTVSAVEAATVAAVTPAGGGAKKTRGGGKKSSGRGKLKDGKCYSHNRYGKEAFTCQAPQECKMKDIIKARPTVADITAEDDDE